mmetsp:Transcript_19303/g.60139  ORF Transcript_19303/g.60139 Transcript_19303/m.60139 type:complete len:329 (+) Transcript_19303:178-1164(+)
MRSRLDRHHLLERVYVHVALAVLKEALVQRAHRLLLALLGHDERDVHLGRSLRHHLNLDAQPRHHREDDGHHRARALDIGDERDDRMPARHAHVGAEREVTHDGVELMRALCESIALELWQLNLLVERERDGNLGRGDHVDGELVRLEGLEDLREEAILAEHARRRDVNHLHARLGRDRRDERLLGLLPRDERALRGRVVRVHHAHRDVDAHRRLHRDRVQDLRAKVGKFLRLLKRHKRHGLGGGAAARVGGEDAVHVLPHLHLVEPGRRAEERRGQIGAAAAEGRDAALAVLADEAGDHTDGALGDSEEALADRRPRVVKHGRVAKV